jgi:hypothetical protein
VRSSEKTRTTKHSNTPLQQPHNRRIDFLLRKGQFLMKRAKLEELPLVPLIPNVYVVEMRLIGPSDEDAKVTRSATLQTGRAAAVAAARAAFEKACAELPVVEVAEDAPRVMWAWGGVLRVTVTAASGELVAFFSRLNDGKVTRDHAVTGHLSDDTQCILCFLWCHEMLEGRKLPKDILKLVATTVRKSTKTLLVGSWSGVPERLYVCSIAVLVPTYDVMFAEETKIVVADSDADAIQMAKRLFVRCIDNRWRDGFESELHDSHSDGDARSGLTKPVNFPADFDETTIDGFSTDMFRWLWDCCDDNMGVNFVHGPAVMELTRNDEVVLRLPQM